MFADFRVHGLNRMGDPDFLYAAPDRIACAAFSKESRMKFANPLNSTGNLGDPDFLYAAPDRTACAAFSKESRMKFANATKLHRKSGGSPSFVSSCKSAKTGGESIGKRSCSTHVRESPRTWGTRPGKQGLVGSLEGGGRNDSQTPKLRLS
jgi:hypothetical protein